MHIVHHSQMTFNSNMRCRILKKMMMIDFIEKGNELEAKDLYRSSIFVYLLET